MLEAIGVIYPTAGVEPPPFSFEHPPSVGHPLDEMVLVPLAPPSEV